MTSSRVARGGDHAPDYVHAKHMYDLQAVRACGGGGGGTRRFQGAIERKGGEEERRRRCSTEEDVRGARVSLPYLFRAYRSADSSRS